MHWGHCSLENELEERRSLGRKHDAVFCKVGQTWLVLSLSLQWMKLHLPGGPIRKSGNSCYDKNPQSQDH